jgi:hypothetical protein
MMLSPLTAARFDRAAAAARGLTGEAHRKAIVASLRLDWPKHSTVSADHTGPGCVRCIEEGLQA